MRILYIASVRIPNEKASGLAIMRQCEAFSAVGHEVTLLVPHRTNKISDEPFTYYGMVPTFAIKTMRSIDFYSFLGMIGFFVARLSQMWASYQYIRTHLQEFDVVYTRDPWMAYLPLKCQLQLHVGLEIHKTYEHRMCRFAIQHAQTLIAISEGLRDYLRQQSQRKDIVIEPSGVHLSQFEITETQEEVRTMFDIPHHKHVIGYIGKYTTMGEEKGVDTLIDAVGKLRTVDTQAYLLLVGLELHEVAVAQKRCEAAGLTTDDVKFLPLTQRDFARYTKASDVLVINYPRTTHFATYMSPTKLFAYIGSKTAVVASDLPAVREIVDESMVYLIPPNDSAALSDALRKVLTHHVETKHMIERAYAQITHFSWTQRAERILARLMQHAHQEGTS